MILFFLAEIFRHPCRIGLGVIIIDPVLSVAFPGYPYRFSSHLPPRRFHFNVAIDMPPLNK
jgi:hypothetical protein